MYVLEIQVLEVCQAGERAHVRASIGGEWVIGQREGVESIEHAELVEFDVANEAKVAQIRQRRGGSRVPVLHGASLEFQPAQISHLHNAVPYLRQVRENRSFGNESEGAYFRMQVRHADLEHLEARQVR